ncbi:hypothetical protein JD969_05240 [Planctomycetota bacterium]|nr:hypothetical protein JD969_05240 [Planctomycetota bacterium]
MHKFLIVINILALIVFTLALVFTEFSTIGGPTKVTSLDRVQAFKVDVVQEHFPQLVDAGGVKRYDTGRWIASFERTSAYLNLFLAYAIVIINLLIVIIHKLFFTKSKNQLLAPNNE